MFRPFLSLKTLTVAALLAGTAVGCADERPPIDRVQPDGLQKSFFVGEDLQDPSDDPEFYAQGTLVDVGFGATQMGLFTNTFAQPLNRVKWQITENYLIARITFERIEDSDGKGAGPATNDGVIAAMFRIQKHFDIQKAYNPTTGEELNIVEENAFDRPWYEREYMRVDWSSNLATDTYDFDTLSMVGLYGGVTYEPVSYYVNDPSDPDAPRFDLEDGYFDITTKAFAKPEMIDLRKFNWGIDQFPACFLPNDFMGGSYPAGNCNPTELTLRFAFKRIEPTDYEPAHWDGWRFQAFGAFTEDRLGFARHYGMVDAKWKRFIARYNIWERSHYYENPDTMEGSVACFTPLTTPFGMDPHRDLDGNGTEDECESVGRGSRCNEFTQKCTLPYRDRQEKPVVYYYTTGNDPVYFESSYEAAHNWDVAMRSAVMTARYAECRKVGDDNCEKDYPVYYGQQVDNDAAMNLAREVDDCRNGRAYFDRNGDFEACNKLADELGAKRGDSEGVIALAKMDEMVVLCHSPVEFGDPEVCGEPRLPEGFSSFDCNKPADAETREICDAARGARLGDIRFNQVTVIEAPQTGSPWGIMVDAADPLTGENVQANVNVWSSITDRWSASMVDIARYVGGELSIEAITEGENIDNWAEASRVTAGSSSLPTFTQDQLKDKLAKSVGLQKSDLDRMGTPDPHITALAKEVKDQMRGIVAMAGAPSSNAPTYAARREVAQDTEMEAALMTRMMQQYGGVSGLPMNQATLNAGSPLRGANPTVQREFRQLTELALAERGSCIMYEAPAPMGVADFVDLLQEKFGAFNPEDSLEVQEARAERMRRYLAERSNLGVMAHEMGHSFGERHNFVSSSDAFMYRPQYWQLRTKNGQITSVCDDLSTDGEDCIGPRYFDPVTDEERDNFIWSFMHSSVMDYQGELTQEVRGLGVYDFAATRAFYGDVMAVFADPSFNEGTARAKGLLPRVDNFGGILGFQPEYNGEDIHYSEYNKYYDFIYNCREVDPEDWRPAAWDEENYGPWHPTFDGMIVKVDGKYTMCEDQKVDYTTWDQLRMPTNAGSYRGGPSIEASTNRLRVPYGFGTDNWADLGNLSVYRFDNGADPYELFDFLITQQEVGHIFDNYRRGRTDFSVRGAAGRSVGRFSEKLRDAAKGLGLMKTIYRQVAIGDGYDVDGLWGYIATAFFSQNLLTSGIGFDHFARLLARPQDGPHSFQGPERILRSDVDSWSNSASIARVNIPNGATGFYRQVGFGGRPLQNNLADDQGEYDSEYTLNAGSYYDKTWTAMLMTESVDNFISATRSDFYDARYRSVSLADLFPDGYRRWLANNLTGDDFIKGPRLVANASLSPEVERSRFPSHPIGWTSWWLPDGPEICFPNEKSIVCSDYSGETNPYAPDAPQYTVPIDPQVGWEQQKFLIAWTLIYLPENQQQWWIDMLQMWELGPDTDPGYDNRIELRHPTGKTYVAKTFGKEIIFGQEVQKGISARILEYANNLMSEAYEGNWVLGPDGVTEWYVADLNPATGEPLVLFDANMLSVNPDGSAGVGRPGCDASDNSECTCSSNRACLELEEYMSIPRFLRQSLARMGLMQAEWKGVY